MGHARQARDDLEVAARYYRRAIECEPNYATARSNLGFVLLLLQGDTDAAVFEQQDAVRLEPNLAVAHYNVGNALSRAE